MSRYSKRGRNRLRAQGLWKHGHESKADFAARTGLLPSPNPNRPTRAPSRFLNGRHTATRSWVAWMGRRRELRQAEAAEREHRARLQNIVDEHAARRIQEAEHARR